MVRKLSIVTSVALAALSEVERLIPGGITMETFNHPESMLNFVRLGKMGLAVGDGMVGTYDFMANDATRSASAWRKRLTDSLDATLSAKEELVHMLAESDRLPKRIVTTVLGLSPDAAPMVGPSSLAGSVGSQGSVGLQGNVRGGLLAGGQVRAAAPSDQYEPSGPGSGLLGGRLQTGLNELMTGGLSTGYRAAFGPLATTLRMKRSIFGLDQPLPAAPEERELPAAPEPTPAPCAQAEPVPAPPAGNANFISFPFFLSAGQVPGAFTPMIAGGPAGPTTTTVSPCMGEVEQRTKVYIDKFGHMKMTIETLAPTTGTAEGAGLAEATYVADVADLTETDMLPEAPNVISSALAVPNFDKIDEVIDSLPFQGKYIGDQEGQAVEISETDSNVLKEQLKTQLRNKLWTEWVEDVVTAVDAPDAAAEAS